MQGCEKLEELSFRKQHLCNPICSLPSYAAAVAAAVGNSLHTLDGESLVVHLGRMASSGEGRADRGGERRDQGFVLDPGSGKAARSGPGGAGVDATVKVPANQLQEVFFPDRVRGTRLKALPQVCMMVWAGSVV
jgi:hypothetical protein